MEYTIQLAFDTDVVRLKAQGAFDAETLIQLLGRGRERGRAHGSPLLLCDVRQARVEAEVFELFDNIEGMERLGVRRDERVAILCSPQDTGFLHLEEAAAEHGLAIRVFTQKPLAIAWLRAGHLTQSEVRAEHQPKPPERRAN